MSKFNIRPSLFMYTDAEVESAGKPAPDDPVDFTYPDGIFRLANSLDFLPDTKTRLQMAYGLVMTLVNI